LYQITIVFAQSRALDADIGAKAAKIGFVPYTYHFSDSH